MEIAFVRSGSEVMLGVGRLAADGYIGDSSVLFTCLRVKALRLLFYSRSIHSGEDYVICPVTRSWRWTNGGAVAVDGDEAVYPAMLNFAKSRDEPSTRDKLTSMRSK